MIIQFDLDLDLLKITSCTTCVLQCIHTFCGNEASSTSRCLQYKKKHSLASTLFVLVCEVREKKEYERRKVFKEMAAVWDRSQVLEGWILPFNLRILGLFSRSINALALW